jgi:DNA modification methylase
MAGDTAALLSTDPPYCVDYTGADRPNASGKDWSDKYREVEISDLGEFLRAVMTAVLPHTRESAAIYVWHAHLQYPVIDAVFREFDILCHQPIIWKKPSSTFTYAYYRWAHEPCLFGWRRGHKPPHYLANGMTSVWEADWEGKQRVVGNEHPTQKPLRLFEIPMEQHTRRGEVVLEPFSGSGSQLIAAEQLRRRCRAMEISPAFVDVAVRRWELATGKQAVLDGDGRTFAEITEERAS